MTKKYIITSEQMFNFNKPHYNGHICGTGPHRDNSKYNRKREKEKWRRNASEE